jgi:hypothetical protein
MAPRLIVMIANQSGDLLFKSLLPSLHPRQCIAEPLTAADFPLGLWSPKCDERPYSRLPPAAYS